MGLSAVVMCDEFRWNGWPWLVRQTVASTHCCVANNFKKGFLCFAWITFSEFNEPYSETESCKAEIRFGSARSPFLATTNNDNFIASERTTIEFRSFARQHANDKKMKKRKMVINDWRSEARLCFINHHRFTSAFSVRLVEAPDARSLTITLSLRKVFLFFFKIHFYYLLLFFAIIEPDDEYVLYIQCVVSSSNRCGRWIVVVAVAQCTIRRTGTVHTRQRIERTPDFHLSWK